MADEIPDKIVRQIEKAGLPKVGALHYEPRLEKNKTGKFVIRKEAVRNGPKTGKMGFVDISGRIWIKDRAHAGDPDHWDVQIDGGMEYFRVDLQGNLLP